MATRKMTLEIAPAMNEQDVADFLNRLQAMIDSANLSADITVNTKGIERGSLERTEDDRDLSKETAAGAKSKRDILWSMLNKEKSDDPEIQKQTKIMQMGQEAMQTGIKGLTSITQGSFDFLEMIYNQLKSASPLLQTIESLFNLAVTLFFMPLGNKLAEVLLPAVLDLVDNIVDMWDAMEGMSISEIITTMMETGVTYFGQFFTDIGDTLIEQGGLLGGIGNLLKSLGEFIQGPAVGLLEDLIGLINFVVNHLKEIISLIVAFYTMQYTMQLLAMYANAAGQTLFGLGGAGLAAVTVGAGIAGGLASYGIMSKYGMAEGGYVPATEGGQWRLLGEGGQGEYVIPENEVNAIGGTTNNYYYFQGYTDDDVIRMIRDEVSSQVSQARIRGGF